jgi:hypothetical protein
MAPLSQSEKVEVIRKKVVAAVSLFEHREGSKQVDIKDIGALVREFYIILVQSGATLHVPCNP